MACAHCQQRIDRTLADILELYALAEGELVPGSGSGQRGSGRSIGVRIAALDFLAGNDVVASLYQWERDWRELWALSVSDDVSSQSARPPGWRPIATLSSTVRFLRAWLPKACDEHPAIDEFAKEVQQLHAVALSAARVSTGGRGQATQCPTILDDGTSCGRTLRFEILPDLPGHKAKIPPVTCRSCGATRSVETLITVALSDGRGEVWVDIEAASRQFGLNERTIRQWAKRKIVQTDGHGRYGLGSISRAIRGEAGYQRLAGEIGLT